MKKTRPQPAVSLQLMPIAEFARVMGMSVWTARAWAYRGRIASCKVGKLLQVPVSETVRVFAEGLRPRAKRAGGAVSPVPKSTKAEAGAVRAGGGA